MHLLQMTAGCIVQNILSALFHLVLTTSEAGTIIIPSLIPSPESSEHQNFILTATWQFYLAADFSSGFSILLVVNGIAVHLDVQAKLKSNSSLRTFNIIQSSRSCLHLLKKKKQISPDQKSHKFIYFSLFLCISYLLINNNLCKTL